MNVNDELGRYIAYFALSTGMPTYTLACSIYSEMTFKGYFLLYFV
jgi:hypothetical protein